MRHTFAVRSHILRDDRGVEVGRVHLTDTSEYEVRLAKTFDARATTRLWMVRSAHVPGGERLPLDQSG